MSSVVPVTVVVVPDLDESMVSQKWIPVAEKGVKASWVRRKPRGREDQGFGSGASQGFCSKSDILKNVRRRSECNPGMLRAPIAGKVKAFWKGDDPMDSESARKGRCVLREGGEVVPEG